MEESTYTILNQYDEFIEVTGDGDELSNECDTTQNFSYLPCSNLKIITLDNSEEYFVTTEEDNLPTIEPHLINAEEVETDTTVFSSINNEETEDSDAIIDVSSAKNESIMLEDDTKYSIIHVVNDSDEAYIYWDHTTQDEYVVNDHRVNNLGNNSKIVTKLKDRSSTKPYECTEEGCDKTFSTNYSLKAHIRIHTGERPFTCRICMKRFKTSGDLQRHTRTHTGEKPFMCPIEGCGRAFTTSNIRKVHVRSHTGERPYICDYPNCGKAFSSATNYKNHTRIHSGEKPYVCSEEGCEKRFTEYSSLYKHSAVHRTERPFECELCQTKFKSETTMSRHKVLHHSRIVSPEGIEIIFA